MLFTFLFLQANSGIAQNSTRQVKFWITKARQYMNPNPDSCIYYSELIQSKATRQGNYWAMSKSLTYSGRAKEKKGDPFNAIRDYFDALMWISKADTTDDYNTGVITRNIANIQIDHFNYEEALKYYDSALFYFNRHVLENPKVAKQDRDYLQLYTTEYFKVEALRGVKDIESAQKTLVRLLNDKQTPNRTAINSIYQIGKIFNDLNEPDSAKKYFQQGIADVRADSLRKAQGYHNLAMVNFQQGDYEQAISLYTKAVAIKNKLKRKESLFISLLDLGESHLMNGNLKLARSRFGQAINTLTTASINANPEYYIIYHFMSLASGEDMEANWEYQRKFVDCSQGFLRMQQKIKDEARKRAFNLSLDQYRANIQHQEEVNGLDRKYSIWIVIILVLATAASIIGAKTLIVLWRKKREKKLNNVLRPRKIHTP